jgi:hypothetical protein
MTYREPTNKFSWPGLDGATIQPSRRQSRAMRLKQAPEGVSGTEALGFPGAGGPALAVRVDRAGVVRCGPVRVSGHVLLGDRLAGDPVPLFPFGRAAWLVVGVQE